MLLAADGSWFIPTLVLLPVMGGILIAIIAIVTDQRRKMQRDDMEATLKMEMIERGYQVDEIERVLAARLGTRFPRSGKRSRYQHGASSDYSPAEGQ